MASLGSGLGRLGCLGRFCCLCLGRLLHEIFVVDQFGPIGGKHFRRSFGDGRGGLVFNGLGPSMLWLGRHCLRTFRRLNRLRRRLRHLLDRRLLDRLQRFRFCSYGFGDVGRFRCIVDRHGLGVHRFDRDGVKHGDHGDIDRVLDLQGFPSLHGVLGAAEKCYAGKIGALHEHRIFRGEEEERRHGHMKDARHDQRELPFAMEVRRLCRLRAKRLSCCVRELAVAICEKMPLGRLANSPLKRAVRDGESGIVRLEVGQCHAGQRPHGPAGSEGWFESGRHRLYAEDEGRLRLGLQLAETGFRVDAHAGAFGRVVDKHAADLGAVRA